MRKESRRYGKRFSAPFAKWPCGHRQNPGRKHKGRRRPPVIVRGK